MGSAPQTPSRPGQWQDPVRDLRDQRKALLDLLRLRSAERAGMARRLEAVEKELRELRDTRSYQAARAVSEARTGWQAAFRLPLTLFRLLTRPSGDRDAGLRPETDAGEPVARLEGGRSEMRMLAIVDEFTEHGLTGECDLLFATPGMSVEEIRGFQPHCLFVESAWNGNRGAWRDKVVPASDELVELLSRCQDCGVATVFWNKEDPRHFEHFLPTARLFDLILTTDANCVREYAARTGGRQAGVLQFACQPGIHNPISTGERRDAFVFAGSYYDQYPERAKEFDELVEAASSFREVRIYDRNEGVQGFEFPPRYREMIGGSVPAERIHEVYKAYRYAINLNTVQDSPTMFSRRVLELLACNTLTVSNPSLGMDEAVDGAVVTGRDADEIRRRLAVLMGDEVAMRRLRLKGLRAVMKDHTWSDRLHALRRLLALADGPGNDVIAVVAFATGPAEARAVLSMFDSQTYPHRRLLLASPQPLPATDRADVAFVDPRAADGLPDCLAVAPWSAEDTYGPNYLMDLALARKYAPAAAVGKSEYLRRARDGKAERVAGNRYAYVESLPLRCSLVLARTLLPTTVAELLERLPHGRLQGEGLLAVDEFNYFMHGHGEMPGEADDSSPVPGIPSRPPVAGS